MRAVRALALASIRNEPACINGRIWTTERKAMRDNQDTLVAAWMIEEKALHCPIPCRDALLRIARRLRQWYEGSASDGQI